jgi:hypothetical protein
VQGTATIKFFMMLFKALHEQRALKQKPCGDEPVNDMDQQLKNSSSRDRTA